MVPANIVINIPAKSQLRLSMMKNGTLQLQELKHSLAQPVIDASVKVPKKQNLSM